ncbi:MAG: transketolase, partial [Coriobacteriales bacterium]|nr:transketolase [Coriobacteriales bacterium]
MRHRPEEPDWPGRDRFILSKGHAAPVLYATMAQAGYLPTSELTTLRKFRSRLQGHPDMSKLPGVEVSTGSLGQGLSIAAGLAYALRVQAEDADKAAQRVITLLGDGECQEGQVWEAAMFAGNQGLGNLVAVIDQNGLQIDGPTADVNDLRDLAAKFREFGWFCLDVDGHDLVALHQAFSSVCQ